MVVVRGRDGGKRQAMATTEAQVDGVGETEHTAAAAYRRNKVVKRKQSAVLEKGKRGGGVVKDCRDDGGLFMAKRPPAPGDYLHINPDDAGQTYVIGPTQREPTMLPLPPTTAKASLANSPS